MISPQMVEHNQFVRKQYKLTNDILSDPGNTLAARYGLRFVLPEDIQNLYRQFGIDVPKYNGDDSWSLPMPARLVIDAEGIVRHKAINADYTVRPEPEETLDIIRKMA